MAFREEESCLDTIRVALRDAYTFFHKGAVLDANGIPIFSAGGEGNTPITVVEATQLLDSFRALLLTCSESTNANQKQREFIIHRSTSTDLFTTITNFVFQPLIFSPNKAVTGFSLQQQFQDVRVSALQALSTFFMLASNSEAEGSQCLAAVLESRTLEGILFILASTASSELLRCSASETLFVFVLKIHGAGRVLMNIRGGQSVLSCLVVENSCAVRNYLCSTLRELGGSELCGIPNMYHTATKLMVMDLSVDVRCMTTEIVEIITQCAPGGGPALASTSCQDLLSSIRDSLGKEKESSVVEAMCHLLETMVVIAEQLPNSPFFECSLLLNIPTKVLLDCFKLAPNAASSAARTFRLCLQCFPFRPSIAEKVVNNFASLSLLLKCTVDAAAVLSVSQQKTSLNTEKTATSARILCVELGIAVALILAQNPSCRHHLSSELNQYPIWANNLKQSIIGYLNSAALDYFVGLDLVDVTGSMINSIDGVSWIKGDANDEKPKKSTVKSIFLAQEERVGRDANSMPPVRTTNKPRPNDDVSVARRCKLTFMILSYAVHLTFTPATEVPTVPPPLSNNMDNRFMHPPALGTPPSTIIAPTHTGIMSPFPLSSLPQHSFNPQTPTPPPAFKPGSSGASLHQPFVELMPAAATSSRVVQQAPMSTPKQTTTTPVRSHMFPKSTSAASPRGPLFPSAKPPGSSATNKRMFLSTAPTPQERDAMASAYDRFDSAFKLTMHFAQLYGKAHQDRFGVGGMQEPVYVSTSDGFAVRAPSLLRNPWASKVKHERLKTWTMKDLHEGDLFYFSVTFDELTIAAVDVVIDKAKRHMSVVKKGMVVTPQTSKGRRWLLYDILNNVIPGTIKLLGELRTQLTYHGDSNVRFPIFLFREKEIHLGERAVHSGNIFDVVHQVHFYFSQDPEKMIQMDPSFVSHVNERMGELASKRFTGEEALSDADSMDDGNIPGRGHGDLSSDSD